MARRYVAKSERHERGRYVRLNLLHRSNHVFVKAILHNAQETCIRKCSEKFVKFAARAGMRFQEHQQEMAQEAARAAGQ